MLLILPMAKMRLRIYRCLQYKLPIFNFKAGHIERQIKCCWRKLLLQLAVNLGAQTVWERNCSSLNIFDDKGGCAIDGERFGYHRNRNGYARYINSGSGDHSIINKVQLQVVCFYQAVRQVAQCLRSLACKFCLGECDRYGLRFSSLLCLVCSLLQNYGLLVKRFHRGW